MVRKVMTLLLIGGALAIAACNTVRGAGADVSSAANCTENAMHGGIADQSPPRGVKCAA